MVAAAARAFLLPALLAAVTLSGCAAFGDVTGVNNQKGSFQFGGNIADKEGSQTFSWVNTHSCAVVQWGGRIMAGRITVQVLDADGAEVYHGNLSGGDRATLRRTADGAPGTWVVNVTFERTTALMGLNLFSGDNTLAIKDGDALVYAGQACEAAARKAYRWDSEGGATLQWAGQALEGRLTATVRDASGTVLGSLTVSPAKSAAQSVAIQGTPGSWRLQVEYEDFTGQVAVRLEPPQAPAA